MGKSFVFRVIMIDQVAWHGFSSCSVDRDVAVQFAGEEGTLFELPASLAVDISSFRFSSSFCFGCFFVVVVHFVFGKKRSP